MYSPLYGIKEYRELSDSLRESEGLLALSGCTESEDAMVISGLCAGYKKTLVICSDEKKVYRLWRDLKNFSRFVYLYPAKDLLFYDADIQGNLISGERINVLRHLIEEERVTVVTTIDGLMDKISSEENVRNEALRLFEGMVIKGGEIKKVLASLGYERVPQVENRGQFSVRGGITDIYPMTETEPVRVEFFDEEIDTIRSFDPESQRSVERLKEIMRPKMQKIYLIWL